jgi:DNA mismatch repair protein MutS
MTNVQDLRIRQDIVPLFDYTRNPYAQEVLISLFGKTLGSVEECKSMQEILRGFIANGPVLQEYAYARTDLADVYEFTRSTDPDTAELQRIKWLMVFSAAEKQWRQSKCIQMITLFQKLLGRYFSRLDTALFPPAYADRVKAMVAFLSSLGLAPLEASARESGLGRADILKLLYRLGARTNKGETDRFWKELFFFEACLSISQGIAAHGLVFPDFGDRLALDRFYHPLLKEPVTNTLRADDRVLVITGANMSGKSTLLKSVSLCVYLGHLGMAVPAAAATMPFFQTIFISIDHTDNLVGGYSHFMQELVSLKQVVQQASEGLKCFAVFDELFMGTTMEDAIEISAVTIKGLAKFEGSLFMVSTHLHELKDLPAISAGHIACFYIACELKEGGPVFTYRLQPGWSDLRLGKILFEREGLNELLGG